MKSFRSLGRANGTFSSKAKAMIAINLNGEPMSVEEDDSMAFFEGLMTRQQVWPLR